METMINSVTKPERTTSGIRWAPTMLFIAISNPVQVDSSTMLTDANNQSNAWSSFKRPVL